MRSLMCALCLVSTAWAAPDAQEILRRVDAEAAKAADLTVELRLTTTPRGGTPTVRTLRLWQKGAGRRMVKILSPPRLRGTGLLRRGDGALFLYLPAFKALRRVAGLARGKPFMGSVFTRDDMARARLAERFTASLVEQTADRWTLRLDPKVSAEAPDHHLVLWVRRVDHQVARVQAFDAAEGAPTRIITATDFRVEKGQALAYKVRAEDPRTGATSVAELGELTVNGGLADDFFDERHLRRAP